MKRYAWIVLILVVGVALAASGCANTSKTQQLDTKVADLEKRLSSLESKFAVPAGDLLKLSGALHKMDVALATKDQTGLADAAGQLKNSYHEYRTTPIWMTISGAVASSSDFPTCQNCHDVFSTHKTPATAASIDAIREGIARNVMKPAYPLLGRLEMMKHHIFEVQDRAEGKKWTEASSSYGELLDDFDKLSTLTPSDWSSDLSALMAMIVGVDAQLKAKSTEDVMKSLKDIDDAVWAMKVKLGVK
ncbi:MAG: hypothetical protein ACYC41_11500 [Bacillota bacterium]